MHLLLSYNQYWAPPLVRRRDLCILAGLRKWQTTHPSQTTEKETIKMDAVHAKQVDTTTASQTQTYVICGKSVVHPQCPPVCDL